jgi:tRNA G18 (ribose-2'-O)-methylase SpoU
MVAAPDTSDFTKEEISNCLNEIRHPFDVAVHGCKNYFNFGAIIRIAHNNLCRNLYSVDMEGYYKRASMSGRKYETINKMTMYEFLEASQGRSIVSFERRPPYLETEPLYSFKWPENPIMFFGSENEGVPDEVLEASSHIVSIPVYGILNDHNVAVASGIVMYDWLNKYYMCKNH